MVLAAAICQAARVIGRSARNVENALIHRRASGYLVPYNMHISISAGYVLSGFKLLCNVFACRAGGCLQRAHSWQKRYSMASSLSCRGIMVFDAQQLMRYLGNEKVVDPNAVSAGTGVGDSSVDETCATYEERMSYPARAGRPSREAFIATKAGQKRRSIAGDSAGSCRRREKPARWQRGDKIDRYGTADMKRADGLSRRRCRLTRH